MRAGKSREQGSGGVVVEKQRDEEVGLVKEEIVEKPAVAPTQPRSKLAYMALGLLAVQNCSAVLVMRYTRATPGQNLYNTQTAVVMQEVMKTVASAFLVVKDKGELRSTFSNMPELLRTSVPAVLYLIQNNLQYVAVSNLHAATYQVTYQLKILSTALLSVCLLGRQLSRTKWLALVVLTAGVAAVQLSELGDTSPLSTSTESKTPKVPEEEAAIIEQQEAATADVVASSVNAVVGLGATLLATLSSGCAGVYFEKMLKGRSDLTLWQRNTQLGLYSIIIGLAAIVTTPTSRHQVLESGFFYGYTNLTFVNLAVQAFGGLIIAVVIKFADNILKNFATSVSIILSVIFSALFLGQSLSYLFLLGVLLVNYAVFLYAR